MTSPDALSIAAFLLWLSGCAALLIYACTQAFRLAVLVTSALMGLEEDKR